MVNPTALKSPEQRQEQDFLAHEQPSNLGQKAPPGEARIVCGSGILRNTENGRFAHGRLREGDAGVAVRPVLAAVVTAVVIVEAAGASRTEARRPPAQIRRGEVLQ